MKLVPATPPEFWENLEAYNCLSVYTIETGPYSEIPKERVRLGSEIVGHYITNGAHRWKVVGLGEINGFGSPEFIWFHNVLKNGNLSRAKNARWSTNTDWALEMLRPSPLEQLAEVAE